MAGSAAGKGDALRYHLADAQEFHGRIIADARIILCSNNGNLTGTAPAFTEC